MGGLSARFPLIIVYVRTPLDCFPCLPERHYLCRREGRSLGEIKRPYNGHEECDDGGRGGDCRQGRSHFKTVNGHCLVTWRNLSVWQHIKTRLAINVKTEFKENAGDIDENCQGICWPMKNVAIREFVGL